tara:strand:- start:1817 stop:2497 length:681 start_codon:yes stop_codon:yes gene_type:complete
MIHQLTHNNKNMEYKIIVARFKENINWLSPIMDKCIIYNKGPKLNLLNEIPLKNVGRESHTYLHYIINNYNNLPDIVIFTQGNISDHISHNHQNQPSTYLLSLLQECLNSKLGKSIPKAQYYGNNRGPWRPDFNENDRRSRFLLNNGNCPYKNKIYISFRKWFKKYIKRDYPDDAKIYKNGLFAVNKQLILKNPCSYYKKLLSNVNHDVNPVEGHFMERSWFYIFY